MLRVPDLELFKNLDEMGEPSPKELKYTGARLGPTDHFPVALSISATASSGSRASKMDFLGRSFGEESASFFSIGLGSSLYRSEVLSAMASTCSGEAMSDSGERSGDLFVLSFETPRSLFPDYEAARRSFARLPLPDSSPAGSSEFRESDTIPSLSPGTPDEFCSPASPGSFVPVSDFSAEGL